jgi:hypothetical protein
MRLIHTEPLERVRDRQKTADALFHDTGHAHVYLTKSGGDAVTTHALSGELYASQSGWILLDVPNALVRGAFTALNEHGVELPTKSNGQLNAHISVMRPEEIEQIGGIDKVTERGHHFHYTLGPIQEVKPSGWDEMSKVWFIQVRSTELQNLRKSYGLSPKPKDGEHDFHITIAVRRKKILHDNEISKAAEHQGDEHAVLAESASSTNQAEESEGRGHVGTGGASNLSSELYCQGQAEDFDCAPTALKAIFDYYGVAETEEISALRAELETTPEGGTTPDAIVQGAKAHGLNAVAKSMSIDELKAHLDEGHPVIVNYQAGTPGVDMCGHYAIAVGYGENTLKLRDSSRPDEDVEIAISDFESRWHDSDKHGNPYERLGIPIWEGDGAEVQEGSGSIRNDEAAAGGGYVRDDAVSDDADVSLEAGPTDDREDDEKTAGESLMEQLGRCAARHGALTALFAGMQED